MVKLKSPLLSFDARNTISKAITFVKRKGQNIAEKKPEIMDVKSTAQLSWRHMYQKCAALWHTLSVAEQQEWESLARPKHMTGFAYWQSQCLRPNPGIYLPLQGGTMQGDIDMAKFRVLRLPAPADPQEALRLSEYTNTIEPQLMNEGARVYHNIDLAIPDVTVTNLVFNSERYDTDTIHDPIGAPDKLTCRTAGKYYIALLASFYDNAVGSRFWYIYLNRVTYIARGAQNQVAPGAAYMTISCVYDLAVGDYVEARVWQSSGAALSIKASASFSPEFMMQRIGA